MRYQLAELTGPPPQRGACGAYPSSRESEGQTRFGRAREGSTMRARVAVVEAEAPGPATTPHASTPRSSGALAVAQEAVRAALAPSRRNVLHWVSWLLALSTVIGVTVLLADGQVFAWEQELTRRAQDLGMPTWLFRAVSAEFVDAYAWQGAVITLAIISGLWLFRQRAAAVVLLLVFPLHGLANFPKVLIDRDRPSDLFDGIVGGGGGMSFASGHSEFVVTFYGFLTYLALLRLPGRAQQVALVLTLLFFIGMVGFGRVAHGHHWPLDVIVGYIAGLGLLSGLIWLHSALWRATEEATMEGQIAGRHGGLGDEKDGR